MARVKLAVFIADLAGKIGSVVATRSHYGLSLRERVIPSNPKSSYQSTYRSRMTTLSQGWKALTDAQRLVWETLAGTLKATNVFGETAMYNGFNTYVQLNSNRLLIGKTILSDAPAATYPTALTSFTIATNTVAALSLTFGASPLPAKNHLVINGTPGISAGKSFVGSLLRHFKVSIPAATTPIDAHASYLARFGARVAGQVVHLEAFPIYEDSGLPGPVMKASLVVSA
jgi:hypothetical protein